METLDQDGGFDGGQADAGFFVPEKCIVPALIDHNTLLTRDCAPWRVLQPVLVEGDAQPFLEIAPGVVLDFAPETSLTVGWNRPGGLQAIGSPVQKKQGWVYFTSTSAAAQPGDWSGIVFGPYTLPRSEISWADIKYTGGPFASQRASLNAAIRVFGNDRSVHPRLTDLTIEASGGSIFAFVGPGAGFSTDSARIYVPSWDAQNGGGYPLSIGPNQVDSIPTSLVFGSTIPGIELNCEYETVSQIPCRVDHDARWQVPTLDQLKAVPFVFGSHVVVGAPPASPDAATLTLADNSLCEMLPYSGLEVASHDTNGLGNLVAEGALFADVAFVEKLAIDQPPWDGITFTVPAGGMAGSRLTKCGIAGARGIGEPGMAAPVFVDGRGTALPQVGPTISDCGIYTLDGGCALAWDHIANGSDYGSNYEASSQTITVCHP